MEEDEETTPIKQLNIEDKDGVLHQYEIKDAKAREDIDSAKILDFDNKQFVVSDKPTSIGITIQTDIENQGNYLRGDGNWVDLSADIPALSQETDYLKVSLNQNGETIYGGMIGNHNINSGNAGKILRINTEGTGLELVKNGLSYVEKYIPELGEQYVSINCDYNTLTNLKVIPNETIDLTINLPLQPKSDIVYHAIIQFTCDTGNKLANVILKYGTDYFNVCKFPTSYIDDLVYQIIIYNDCATIIPFGDDTIKKKDSDEQEWVLNEYSDLLHFFKDMGEEGEVHNGTPVDRAECSNTIVKIDIEPKLAIVNENVELGNSIIDINIEPKLAIVNEYGEFGNSIIDINIEPKLAIENEKSFINNSIFKINIEPKLGICENNFNITNSIIEIEDIEEEINGD